MRVKLRTCSVRKWQPRRLASAAPGLLLLVLSLVVAGCGIPGTIASGGHLEGVSATATTSALPPVRFPQDEAPHHDLTEWWYYTGHFQGTDAHGELRYYGFELVFFQTLRGDFSPYYAAHFAISDISGGTFHFDQRYGFLPESVIPPSGSRSGFNLALGGWSMRGLNGQDQLAAATSDYAIAFQLRATKPPVLQGQNGLITYGSAGFSYYYSRTRMQLSGTLTDHGQTLPITGQAWMDHQWGDFVSLLGSGWDWYSIQLANDTEYMLYIIRDSNKRPVATVGTYVDANGDFRPIPAGDIQARAVSTWTSPHTGAVYPSGWKVEIVGQHLSLTLTPQLLDQELLTTASTGNAYWEGAVSISGTVGSQAISGVGYVELTGYASSSPAS